MNDSVLSLVFYLIIVYVNQAILAMKIHLSCVHGAISWILLLHLESLKDEGSL